LLFSSASSQAWRENNYPNYLVAESEGKLLICYQFHTFTYFYTHLGPGTYAFRSETGGTATMNWQLKAEELFQNGTVQGTKGSMYKKGKVKVVNYVVEDNLYQ
jgi:hypothetical protein